MFNFSNQHFVITGGSSGIGLNIANALSDYGADITIIHRHQRSIPSNTFNHIEADLSDPKAISIIEKSIKDQNKPINGLINNAAIADFKSFEDCSDALLIEHIQTNLISPFTLIRAMLPWFTEAASVLNISSYLARKMLPELHTSMYSLTKGGLESLTLSLASELGPRGIRVNAIAPGTVKTTMFNQNIKNATKSQQHTFNQNISARYPLGRIGETDDIAQIALFLASPHASWISGSIISVDGGLTTQ